MTEIVNIEEEEKSTKDAMDKFLNALVGIIRSSVETGINASDTEFCTVGIVRSNSVTNGNLAEVELSFNTYAANRTDAVNLKIRNNTGETLTSGQSVKVFYDDRNMTGAYIGTVLH